MEYYKEYMYEISMGKLYHSTEFLLINDVEKNIPGSLEKYIYYIVQPNPLTLNMIIPEDQISEDEHKFFHKLYLKRKVFTKY